MTRTTHSSFPYMYPERMNVENDPKAIIGFIHQEIALMGANDSEHEQLREILTRLERGELTSEQAVAAAESVKQSKQDYH